MLSSIQTDILLVLLIWNIIVILLVLIVQDVKIIIISLIVITMIIACVVIVYKRPHVDEPPIDVNSSKNIEICEHNIDFFHPRNEDVLSRMSGKQGLNHTYPSRDMSIMNRKQLRKRVLHI